MKLYPLPGETLHTTMPESLCGLRKFSVHPSKSPNRH